MCEIIKYRGFILDTQTHTYTRGFLVLFFFFKECLLLILPGSKIPSLFDFQSPGIIDVLNSTDACTEPWGALLKLLQSTSSLVSPSRAGNPRSSSSGLGAHGQGSSQGWHCTGTGKFFMNPSTMCCYFTPSCLLRSPSATCVFPAALVGCFDGCTSHFSSLL